MRGVYATGGAHPLLEGRQEKIRQVQVANIGQSAYQVPEHHGTSVGMVSSANCR